jgi:uncharacterized membrane protein (DUF106 family)
MAFLDPVLNPLLQPLLNVSPFWAIFILAFAISLVITLAYKYLTNQSEMKRLKEKQKHFQKRMKELRKEPEEMMKVQKEAMSTNMEYMKHSFKATLITMLPILLIFGWMNVHLAYEPIFPGEKFTITAEFEDGVSGLAELQVDQGMTLVSEPAQDINSGVTWRLQGEEGEQFVTVKTEHEEQTKKILITQEVRYEEPLALYDNSDITQIMVNHNKLRPLGKTSIFGWQPGWLGLYILLSIIFSMAMRKAMKIY